MKFCWVNQNLLDEMKFSLWMHFFYCKSTVHSFLMTLDSLIQKEISLLPKGKCLVKKVRTEDAYVINLKNITAVNNKKKYKLWRWPSFLGRKLGN